MGAEDIRIVPQRFENLMWGFSVVGRKPRTAFEWAHSSVAMAQYVLEHIEPLFYKPVFFALVDYPLNTQKEAEVEIPLIRQTPEKVTKDSFGMFALGGGVLHVTQSEAVAAILIPGAPQVGIGHAGSVVHVNVEGDVHKMVADDNLNVHIDPEISILSSVLLEDTFK